MNISWRSNPALTTRRGFTLIETLASLVILGSLLCSLVIARANLSVQQSTAELNLQANKMLDQLLTQWWIEDNENLKDLSQIHEGAIEGNTRFTWRITPLPDQAQAPGNLTQLTLRKVRVTLIDQKTRVESASVELAMPHGVSPETSETLEFQ